MRPSFFHTHKYIEIKIKQKVMITINEKSYDFNYSLRSMFIFEEISGKAFEISTMMDTYIFAYSCILANKNNPSLEFNDFIDACDANPDIIVEFNKFMEEEMKKRELLGKKKVMKKGKKDSR